MTGFTECLLTNGKVSVNPVLFGATGMDTLLPGPFRKKDFRGIHHGQTDFLKALSSRQFPGIADPDRGSIPTTEAGVG